MPSILADPMPHCEMDCVRATAHPHRWILPRYFGGGSLCFEGNTRASCPPAVPAVTGEPVKCESDADCADGDEYESCAQRTSGAFSEAAATRIEVLGSSDGQCLADPQPHTADLVSVFSVPPTFDATMDAGGDLPGPGTVMLRGQLQLQRPAP